MIRVYKDDGEVEIIEASLVEVASTDGKPAMFIVSMPSGALKILRQGDQEFSVLCDRLDLDPARVSET